MRRVGCLFLLALVFNPLIAFATQPPKGVDMSRYLNDINKNWHLLSPAAQDSLRAILHRPTDTHYAIGNISVVYNTPVTSFSAAHFKIFYTEEGEDSATYNFAKTVADAFESSYAVKEAKGYKSPPDDQQVQQTPDLSYDKNGGDSRYDVYLLDIGQNFPGTFGWTQPEKTPSASNDYVKYSFIVMDNDYSTTQYDTSQTPENFVRITASHEFFHAVQYSYNQNVDDWFLEASAVWFEDQAYPNINDYINRYLKGEFKWFSRPELPLDFDTTGNAHKYGSGIWPIFLEKNWSGILKSFFEDATTISNPNVFGTLDSRLQFKGSNLSSAFTKFTAWNYITGKNDDGAHYDDGALYDTLSIYNTTSDYMSNPATTPSTGKIPGYLGSNYLVFNKKESSLRVMFNGSEPQLSNFKWNAAVLTKSGATYTETTIALDAQNAGGITVSSSFDTVVLIPNIYETAHSKSDTSRFPYVYGFSNDTTAPLPVTTITALDSPTDQGYTISLQWSITTDDTTSNYDILRSESTGVGFTLVGSVLSNGSGTYAATNIVARNKTNYYYKIRPRDKWYNYDTVGEIEFGPVQAIDNLPPAAPTNVSAIDTPKDEGGSIDITWAKSADDGNGANDVVKYTICRATNLVGPFQTAGVANAEKTIFHDTTVINNTDYYYYLVAEDGHPNYSYSDTTGHAQAKDDWTPPPTDFKAVGLDNKISLNWKNSTVLDFKKTFIRRKETSHPINENDGTLVHEGADSTFQDTDIIIGKTYYYTAISLDATGNYSEPNDGSRAQAAVTLKAFNYPNPTYSGNTTIRYQLENTSGFEATLYIFDIAGELVLKADNILNNLNNSQVIPDVPVYEYRWDGKNGKGHQVASGVYIFIVEANDGMSKKDRTGKIAVIR